MKEQETIFYAYPIEDFHRSALTEDIKSAYENDETGSSKLPVLKLTAEELTEKINDDSFNDMDYWIRAVKQSNLTFEEEIENLRNNLIRHISDLIKKTGKNKITFNEEWEDNTSVLWFDRHDFPNWSKVNSVGIYNEETLFITCENDCITLYTNSDYGARDLSVLSDIAYLIEQNS